jgi:hypothetical protein
VDEAYIQTHSVSRISIDMTDKKHKKLKSRATLRELEELLDGRIQEAQAGVVTRRTAREIFVQATRKRAK